jgi:ATP-dependent Clp protease ATP-binding subunit ClpC
MELANQMVMRYNHEHLGSEHLLGGVLLEETGSAGEVLRDIGIDPHAVLNRLRAVLVPGPDMVTGGIPRTPCLLQALERAGAEADDLGHYEVDARHLLLGLATVDGAGGELLRQAGVRAEALRDRIGSRARGGNSGDGRCPGGNGAGPA